MIYSSDRASDQASRAPSFVDLAGTTLELPIAAADA